MSTLAERTASVDVKANGVKDDDDLLQPTHQNSARLSCGNGSEGEPSLQPEETGITNLRQDRMNEIIENQIARNRSLRERIDLIRQQRRQLQVAMGVNRDNSRQGRKEAQPKGTKQEEEASPNSNKLDSDAVAQEDTDDNVTARTDRRSRGDGNSIGVAERLLDSLLRERQDALKSYQSILLKRKEVRKFLHLSQRWNVVNDCFHIWHQGPFGTINGLRLGLSEAAATNTMSSVVSTSSTYNRVDGSSTSHNNENLTLDSSVGATASTQPQTTQTRGYWLWSGSSMSPFSSSSNTNEKNGDSKTTTASVTNTSVSSNTSETNQHNHGVGGIVSTQQLQQVPPTPSQPIKIPWLEINSALGHVALLLSCLASKNQSLPTSRHTNLYFPYEVYPMGSNSKIGLLRLIELSTSSTSRYFPSIGSSAKTTSPNSSNVTTELVSLHNLSYSDDSFSLFGKRNFNAALQCLLSIILKAAEQTIQRRDRTMALPHIIAPLNHANTNGGTASAASGSNGGELGIGGLSVSYGIADPIEWTRAMKFVLTDVKWLVAYSAKHVDR